MNKQRVGTEVFWVWCVHTGVLPCAVGHFMHSPVCGIVSVQSKFQKAAKEPFPCGERGTLRRGDGSCIPQRWLKCSWAR